MNTAPNRAALVTVAVGRVKSQDLPPVGVATGVTGATDDSTVVEQVADPHHRLPPAPYLRALHATTAPHQHALHYRCGFTHYACRAPHGPSPMCLVWFTTLLPPGHSFTYHATTPLSPGEQCVPLTGDSRAQLPLLLPLQPTAFLDWFRRPHRTARDHISPSLYPFHTTR